MYEFTTRSEVRLLVLFYNTEQMRLELQEADVYDLIGMDRTEKNMDFSETLLTGVHRVASAPVEMFPSGVVPFPDHLEAIGI